MAIIKRIGTATAVAALCLAFVAPAGAASDITVGDFVQKLAIVKGVASTDAKVANDSLRGLGIRLPRDLEFSSRLTEGHVAAISRAAGLNVLTSNPLSDFTSQQTDAFLSNFKDDLGNENGLRSHDNPGAGDGPGTGLSGPPFDPFTKGKHGKGKGKGIFTPTDPE
jgi:hypothetical protein